MNVARDALRNLIVMSERVINEIDENATNWYNPFVTEVALAQGVWESEEPDVETGMPAPLLPPNPLFDLGTGLPASAAKVGCANCRSVAREEVAKYNRGESWSTAGKCLSCKEAFHRVVQDVWNDTPLEPEKSTATDGIAEDVLSGLEELAGLLLSGDPVEPSFTARTLRDLIAQARMGTETNMDARVETRDVTGIDGYLRTALVIKAGRIESIDVIDEDGAFACRLEISDFGDSPAAMVVDICFGTGDHDAEARQFNEGGRETWDIRPSSSHASVIFKRRGELNLP